MRGTCSYLIDCIPEELQDIIINYKAIDDTYPGFRIISNNVVRRGGRRVSRDAFHVGSSKIENFEAL